MRLEFQADQYFDPGSEALRFLPEGPRVLQNYPGGAATLGWVAIQHGMESPDGSINLLDLETGTNTTFPVNGRPGFFVETTRPGVLLVGLERTLAYFDLATGKREETGIEVSTHERVIINDGLAVEGGVLFGTKHLDFNQPIGALYFFDSETRKVQTVVGGQLCSNGKLMRRDEEGVTIVDIDSIPKTISRYRLDAGIRQVREQSLIALPDSLPGYPDGLRPSPDGESVIVAFYNPAEVADGVAQQFRISDGAVLAEWKIPGSPRVTCPEFVRVDGKVKIVFTTATEGMAAETRKLAPGAGHFYIADTPFDTLPAPPPLVP